ncbi:DUF523 domain-containing protein [Endozoicomonas numazuensis]|uniref:DUF523 domain-containing protein n=1 Tax=Endozoicomonas numazuensis TaxID=1137799 RepID=UPI00068DC21F|nr:DUF523 domain-containing protein [Endozoicomonas numazuensis]
MPKTRAVVISACLLGKKCRFDGGACTHSKVIKAFEEWEIIPLCPEEIGDLATPRPRARIVGEGCSADGNDVLNHQAKVVTEKGEDVTAAMLKKAGVKVVSDVLFMALCCQKNRGLTTFNF